MDTSSPTALAMCGGVYRPDGTAPQRTSPSDKGVFMAKKKPENTEDTAKANLVNNSHVVETSLALPNVYQSFDSWKQKQKRKQQQRPSVISTSTPGQPQQPKSANLHDTKKNSRHSRANMDSVSALVPEAEQKAPASTVPYTGRSSDHDYIEIGTRSWSKTDRFQRHASCGTPRLSNPNFLRPDAPPSTGKLENPDQASSAVSMPPTDPRVRQNSSSQRRSVPVPEFFRPDTVSASESKPVRDCFTASKPHDAARYQESGDSIHKSVENDEKFGRSNIRNIHNSMLQHPFYDSLRCMMPTDYDENDGDVFTLLDEVHAANNNTNPMANASINQGVAMTGRSNLAFTHDPAPWETSECVPDELPHTAPSVPLKAPPCPDATASVWDIDSNGPLALKPLPPRDNPKPSLPARDLANPSYIEQSCRRAAEIANTTANHSTIDRGSTRIGSDRPQSTLSFGPPGVAPDTAFVPEHRGYCPMSLEETDRLVHSLSTNDLIALCTKCQCELQERGRSFTSLLSGSTGDRNNGSATATQGAAATIPDYGVGIGSGRASKDKRKFGAADSDTEENTGAANAKTPAHPQQDEQQKNKKQRSELVSMSPSLHERARQIIRDTFGPSFVWDPSASHLELQSKAKSQPEEAASAEEHGGDDQQLEQQLEDATPRNESERTTATATEMTVAEPLPTHQAVVDKADDVEWQYVKEDSWKSPEPLCGDVFEMVDRQESS
ncbi:hypothetical protein PG996_012813 [Apiospora saccharicola]|uniref:Uncharacterized protein n=1 Tax=Apiospora saccharicola TaxID=335842 RepID=A0ABR1U490_9PEZI